MARNKTYFEPVDLQVNFPELEKEILKSWEKDGKWFDHTITNIRKNDVARMIVLLQKAQEELLLARDDKGE